MSKEIKEKIDALYARLEQEANPSFFVLSPMTLSITNQINALQSQCKHDFVNGICKYCYVEDVNA